MTQIAQNSGFTIKADLHHILSKSGMKLGVVGGTTLQDPKRLADR